MDAWFPNSQTQGEPPDTDKVRSLIEKIGDLHQGTLSFAPGTLIVDEGERNEQVFVILEGEVQMLKRSSTNPALEVDRFGPGDLLGLTSFWSHEPSFLQSKALGPVKCLAIGAGDLDELIRRDPEVRLTIHRLFISNLSNRYRRMILLNVRVAELGDALEREHAQLKQAMHDLEQTRNRMIHQEKLAILGQLLAGIAHEINNPCAALARGVETLTADLPGLFAPGGALEDHADHGHFLAAGLSSPFRAAGEKRERLQSVLARYPRIPRDLARRIAALEDTDRERLQIPRDGNLQDKHRQRIEEHLSLHEIGSALRGVHLSAERIQKLVISLKNYGKQDQAEWQILDLREGIRDTLTVLNNRLKHYDLVLDLDEIPRIEAIGGEMNQVWTNLLVNACQATPEGGRIAIRTRTDGNAILVEVSDRGTGIHPDYLERIFETNFTTRKSRSEFGLGLGLAISRDIVEKHNGTIHASNNPDGGACFRVTLPVAQDRIRS